MSAKETLAWLEKHRYTGICIVNDDAGHWGVSDSGFQKVPDDEPMRDPITCFTDDVEWRDTIVEAVRAFRERHPDD